MSKHLRIAISVPDDHGILAAVSGRLFELGADLGDSTFAVLGEAAEMTCVCEMPDDSSEEEVRAALAALPALQDADISVKPFELAPVHSPTGRATHVLRMRGIDRPGLMARLAEGFTEFGANVVRMDAEHVERDYVMRFEVCIPQDRADACLSNAANIAESLGLQVSLGEV